MRYHHGSTTFKDPNLSGYFFERFALNKDEKLTSKALTIAKIFIAAQPIHFPIAFPEVFLSKSRVLMLF